MTKNDLNSIFRRYELLVENPEEVSIGNKLIGNKLIANWTQPDAVTLLLLFDTIFYSSYVNNNKHIPGMKEATRATHLYIWYSIAEMVMIDKTPKEEFREILLDRYQISCYGLTPRTVEEIYRYAGMIELTGDPSLDIHSFYLRIGRLSRNGRYQYSGNSIDARYWSDKKIMSFWVPWYRVKPRIQQFNNYMVLVHGASIEEVRYDIANVPYDMVKPQDFKIYSWDELKNLQIDEPKEKQEAKPMDLSKRHVIPGMGKAMGMVNPYEDDAKAKELGYNSVAAMKADRIGDSVEKDNSQILLETPDIVKVDGEEYNWEEEDTDTISIFNDTVIYANKINANLFHFKKGPDGKKIYSKKANHLYIHNVLAHLLAEERVDKLKLEKVLKEQYQINVYNLSETTLNQFYKQALIYIRINPKTAAEQMSNYLQREACDGRYWVARKIASFWKVWSFTKKYFDTFLKFAKDKYNRSPEEMVYDICDDVGLNGPPTYDWEVYTYRQLMNHKTMTAVGVSPKAPTPPPTARHLVPGMKRALGEIKPNLKDAELAKSLGLPGVAALKNRRIIGDSVEH